ncbi:MAG TPA: prepilin-type N-terminal cleavage/methylation domain-containing protein [Thermoanaerobacterales bacterium]|nr:prepilin-type N-terminal cleavage/methylation domain-containing protein [Thermoanaerobacterales bacterium]
MGVIRFNNRFFLKKGFTLIEIIVVISIFSVLSLVGLPSFKRTLAHHKLNIAAHQIAQHIRLAQQKALSEGTSYRIIFDLHNKDNYFIKKGNKGQKIYLTKNIVLAWTNFDKDTLIFYMSGAPAQAGTIAIKNNKDKLYIIVSVATGRVRISKTPP